MSTLAEPKGTLSRNTRNRAASRGLLGSISISALLFLGAGRWDYWQGWVYFVIGVVIMVLMSTLLTRDRSLIEERLNPKEGMKGWDKFYFAVTTPLYMIALLLGGLDARHGWSANMPLWVYLAGLGIYLLGEGIFLWARFTNSYFSSVVRIQTDRGQTVCREGPYRIVRHPGYLGGFLFTVTLGIVLGSWWASIPQLLAGLMLLWRTGREDRTLLAELPGYLEYTRETRHRLIPGVW
jgi:protein-S-isoprenylcysteine O-methyltransferase Ste14